MSVKGSTGTRPPKAPQGPSHTTGHYLAQVASKEFFLKTLPLFDGGDDVGMVLSPQCFHNLNLHSDIFNHSNVHFWEYMQPGYDAVGLISCTATNFVVTPPPPPSLLFLPTLHSSSQHCARKFPLKHCA